MCVNRNAISLSVITSALSEHLIVMPSFIRHTCSLYQCLILGFSCRSRASVHCLPRSADQTANLTGLVHHVLCHVAEHRTRNTGKNFTSMQYISLEIKTVDNHLDTRFTTVIRRKLFE